MKKAVLEKYPPREKAKSKNSTCAIAWPSQQQLSSCSVATSYNKYRNRLYRAASTQGGRMT